MPPEPLYNVISGNFSSEELSFLASSLGVDYEDLSGSSRTMKALNLQQFLARRGRLHELLAAAYRQRPHLNLRPHLYIIIAELFSDEEAITDLLQGFDLPVRDFGGPEKFAWGSEPWREQKAQALQLHMQEAERLPELLAALNQRSQYLDLSFFEQGPQEVKPEPAGETRPASEKDKEGQAVIHYHINTGGGSYVAGNVDTGGGEFTGRDKSETREPGDE